MCDYSADDRGNRVDFWRDNAFVAMLDREGVVHGKRDQTVFHNFHGGEKLLDWISTSLWAKEVRDAAWGFVLTKEEREATPLGLFD